MKILYVSQFFTPERVAGAFRAYDNSKLWRKNNEVTVFTGYPNFPTGKLFEGYKIKLLSEESIDGIRVIRSKILIKKNTSKINRIFNAGSFLFFGIINILFNGKEIGEDYDIVLGTSGTILAPIVAYVYSKKYRKKFVLELRDITYRQVLAVYKGKKTIIFKLIKWVELFLCKKAKKIVVVTNGFKQELIRCGIDENKIEVIPNGIETSEIKLSNQNRDRNTIIFSYMGNLGESQDLFKIIEIFNKLKIKKFKKSFFIIGDGAKKEDINKYLVENSIDNIILKDGMKPECLEEYYEKSDFCIVSLKNNKYFEHTIPSKIFQIMGRGKVPLFIGPEGEASSIISEVDSNFIFSEKKNKDLIRNIENNINQCNDIKLYLKELGIEFRKLVEKKFDRTKLADKYLEIFNNMLKEEEY